MTVLVPVLLALLVAIATPCWVQAQRPAPIEPGKAVVSGTLYDPLGAVAEHVPLRISTFGRGGGFAESETDDRGRFRVANLEPGKYSIRTPLTDYVAPQSVQLTADHETAVDVRMSVDEVAANIRVCRDCRPVPLIPRAGTSLQPLPPPLVTPAEPDAGWDAFNAAVFAYPQPLTRANIAGTVQVDGRIDSDGTTVDVHVTSTSDRQLGTTALDVARHLLWSPTRVRGVAMATPLHLTFEFTLDGEGDAPRSLGVQPSAGRAPRR